MTTANATAASLMVMDEDQSVFVRYADGSTLHVSPCGAEFTVLLRAPAAHPLRASQPVRQRTRFAISTYKELMQGALVFRNTYAARPYLPYELIPAADMKPFFSADSEAHWPHVSSCEVERGPGGDTTTTTTTTVRSVEGRASLTLSSSGEDFLVEFLCSISQPEPDVMRNMNIRKDTAAAATATGLVSQQLDQAPSSDPSCRHTPHRGGLLQGTSGPVAKPKATPQSKGCRGTSQPKSEEVLYQCTTSVVQHHSCSSVAPMWRYPLSVARRYRAAAAAHRNQVTPGDPGASAGEESDGATKLKEEEEEEDRRRCPVPEALPLRCPSPHQHRWKVRDPLAQGEEAPDQDFPGELMSVMWCQGVIYRILSGSIPAIEVSPGDGSVIRSNDVLSSYFTHYKHDSRTGQVKEITYLVNSLPPDVPGQVYSIMSIVSRASRLLACYNQARVSSRLPVMPSCLEEGSNRFEPVTFEETLPSTVSCDSHFNPTQTEHSRADIVAAELEKIKRFQFLLEHSRVPGVWEGGSSADLHCGSGSGNANTASEPVDESYIAEALQRTSQAIQDIDAVISAATLT